MTVDTMIPELWAARLQASLLRAPVWPQLCWDVSEYFGDGDRLHVGEITSSVTVRDYTRNTALTAPETITTDDDVLIISQLKYFNALLDDLDRRQTRPELIDEFTRRTASQFALTINDYILGLHAAATTSGNNNFTGDSSANTDYEPATDAGATTRRGISKAILEVWESFNDKFIPLEGRYMVVGPRMARFLLMTMEDQGLSVESHVTARMRAQIMRQWGFEVFLDAGINDALGQTAVRIFFGVRGQGLWYASQVSQIEGMRSEDYMGDIIRGLFAYGALAADPVYLHRWNQGVARS